MDQDVYRTAKSARPAWANALLIAGILVIAAAVMLTAGMSGGWFLLGAAAVTALVSGVLALTRLGK